jgi:HAD superfamily hydrolase (TIGR01662 family)
VSIDAVLCDRDGTLIVDVPYNGDPTRVEPLPTVSEGLDRLREAAVRLAVVSNQSGVARGDLTEDQVEQVNAEVDRLLGPFDAMVWCPHGPEDGCGCRKPAPGLLARAADLLGVPPERCGVIGDIGTDVEAATRAGAAGVLVPTPATRPDEIARAPVVAATFAEAVDLLLRP